jgi:DNA polymerase-4
MASQTAPPRRWIAHLDMDAFYAAVELLRYPQLRGRAVVIGGRRAAVRAAAGEAAGEAMFPRLRDYAGRGVVTTATYEARAFGVHSGMGLMKAAALAPDAILLPADFDEYRRYSALFKAAVAQVAPAFEDRGIDEIYIDLSALAGVHDAPPDDPQRGVRVVAQDIKSRVNEATGLSCSIGISPNKLLSKLCSDLDKPDGLTILAGEEIPARIWPLPVGRINGIGPKAQAKLAALGIASIGELAAAERGWLIERFGPRTGAWLHEAAHGRDERALVLSREPKSLSRETTFERDLHAVRDRGELGVIFTQLCERLAADLQRKGYAAKTIGVKLRFDDFRIVTRETSLAFHTQDAATIRRTGARCIKQAPLQRRLRLLGVRAGGLCSVDALPDAQACGADAAHDQLWLL